jgi:hypothetical protein
MQDEY